MNKFYGERFHKHLRQHLRHDDLSKFELSVRVRNWTKQRLSLHEALLYTEYSPTIWKGPGKVRNTQQSDKETLEYKFKW